jgi:WD40 repeat protein
MIRALPLRLTIMILPQSSSDINVFLMRGQGHGDAVTGFAFSPDGKAIATVTDDRTLRLFRVSDISAKGIPSIKKGVAKDLAGVAFGSSAEDLAVLTKGDSQV